MLIPFNIPFIFCYSHKDEIEQELGISLTWERADQYKASWMSYHLRDVSVENEGDWPRMAKFHAEWSAKICDVILPYLQEETDVDTERLKVIAKIFREWTVQNSKVVSNQDKCNRVYTRFTTPGMSAILPDIPQRTQRMEYRQPLFL